MEISAKELRGKPGQIIEQASRGTEIIITIRGKKKARLVPYKGNLSKTEDVEDEIFGLWKTREENITVDAHVRNLRKGRTF